MDTEPTETLPIADGTARPLKWLVIKLTQWIWYVTIVALVLVATYVALGRNFFPAVSIFKEDLEVRLTEVLGAEVQMRALQGGWDGFDPVLTLKQVEIRPFPDVEEPLRDTILVSEITIQPDVVHSLFGLGLVLERLTLGDITIDLNETASGVNSLDQLLDYMSVSMSQGQGFHWDQLARLLAAPSFELQQLKLHWQRDDESLLHLGIPAMVVQISETSVSASGHVHGLDSNLPIGQFSVLVESTANQALDSALYFAWEDAAFLKPLVDWAVEQEDFFQPISSSGELWLTVNRGSLARISMLVEDTQFAWNAGSACIAPVEGLQFQLGAVNAGGAWQIKVDEFGLDWRTQDLGLSRFSITPVGGRQQNESNAGSFELRADLFNIEMGQTLIRTSGLLPDLASEALADYGPAGWLENLYFRWQPAIEDFVLHANLNDFSVQAYDGAPRVAGITGLLSMSAGQGSIAFSGKDAWLGFPELFAEGWWIGETGGRVDWTYQDEIIGLLGENLFIRDVNGLSADYQGRFEMSIPLGPDDSALRLEIAGPEFDAALVPDLVPGLAVGEELVQWLSTAAPAGTIRNVSYLFQGDISVSGEVSNMTSTLKAALANVDFQPDPQWPGLRGIQGEIHMHNDILSASFQQAVVGETGATAGIVLVTGLDGTNPQLEFATVTRPTARDWVYWLQQSPAAEYAGQLLGDWTIQGDAEVQVSATIPLDGSEPRVKLDVDAKRMELATEQLNIAIDEIYGDIVFDSARGLTAVALTGRLFGEPVSGRMETLKWTDTEQSIQLDMISRIEVSLLKSWLGAETNLPVSGATDYRLSLNLNSSETVSLNYSLESDLVGIVLDFPAPYNKNAEMPLTFKLSRHWSVDNDQGRWGVDFQDWFDASLLDDSGSLQTGLVRFGHEGKFELPGKGIEFVGILPELDIQTWSGFLQELQISLKSAKAPGQDSTDSSAEISALNPELDDSGIAENAEKDSMPGGSKLPDWFAGLAVTIEDLGVAEHRFTNVDVQASRLEGGGLLVGLVNPEQIAGEIIIPNSPDERLRLSFDRLHLAAMEEKSEETRLLPGDLPLADVEIVDLRMGERQLGHWRWSSEDREDGIVFNDLKAEMPGATFNGRLSWLHNPSVDAHTTILTGEINGTEFQEFAKLWTASSPLDSESFNISTGIVWSKRPTEFSWEEVTGKVSFSMAEGKLNDTTASADIFRIFGILNTEALVRRLQLDFSDLYESGLVYDLVEGNARIQEGVVKFESPLAIQAPSSAFKITGTTNLVDDSLDMQMVVVLPLTKNLPLAGLLVGAPQVGGAVYLIDKLLGEPLSALTSATYQIGGSLQKPTIELEQIFEKQPATGGERRRLTEEDL